MKKFNKGDWVATFWGRKGVVVGFKTTLFLEVGVSVLWVGADSPCTVPAPLLKRVEDENEN